VALLLLDADFLFLGIMNPDSSYVLVTPVRDEEKTIGRTIKAVLKQTLLPREWVIVSDGSTDATDEIVRRAAEENPWIRLLALTPRPGRSFAAVVYNTETGIRNLEFRDYAYLGLLDSDVEFQADYFELIMRRFEAEPALGLAGGVVIDVGLPKDRFPRNRIDVPGAVQFFRRECFERIGGLIPIPEGGWDGMTCAMARMQGYKTRLFTDLVVDHLKPRNISEGGVVRRKWQMGVRDHALGYHPLFELVKCVGRLKDQPRVIGALAWWTGYCTAQLQRHPRIVNASVVAYIRGEQMDRLKGIFWKGISPISVTAKEVADMP
jgi:poly-beta-1,6-N-acetyl-D-glucosamine synthase